MRHCPNHLSSHGSRTSRRLRSLLAVGIVVLLGYRAPLARAQERSSDDLRRLNQSVDTLVKRVSPSVVQILVSGYGPLEENVANALRRRSDHWIRFCDRRDRLHRDECARGAWGRAPASRFAESRCRELARGGAFHADPRRSCSDCWRVERTRSCGSQSRRGEAARPFPGGLPQAGPGRDGLCLREPEGLRNSVTMGVVSAVARQTDPDSPMVYIQTDAAINPGNSGGPLVNVDRQVVGVSTFILSQSGGNEGLGFAVPSGVVGVAYRQLRNFGHLHRAQIGIGLQTITPVLAAALRLPRDYGVVISDVLPDSPAAAFGLQIGDVLAVLDGRPGRIFPSSHFTFFLWNTVKRSIWTFFAGRLACRLMCRWLSHHVTRTKSPRWRTRRKAWLRRSEFLPWKSIKGLPPWFRISATRLEFL